MTKHTTKGGHSEKAMQEKAEAQLKDVFQGMPYDVSLVLFTDPAGNEPYNRAAREVTRAVRTMAPKLSLREYSLDHEMAQAWSVTVREGGRSR